MRLKKIGCLALSVLCAMSLGACSSAGDPFNEEGLKKYAEGAYADAVAVFDKAIAADNQEEEFFVNKGMAYLEMEDYASAHKAFESALKLEAECQAAYRGNGIAYMEEGDYESAMQAFELALSCKSGKVSETEYDILLYRGETQTRMGDYEGAVETYTVLLDTQGKKAMTYYLRGIAKVKGGEIEAGMEDMDTAISLDKNNYDMYLNCYYCLADEGQEDLGIQYLQDALIIDEKANASHKSRGAVNFLLGDYNAALTQFEYEGETDDVETLIYIGLCHQSLGDTNKSYEAFSKALANGGENAEVYYQMGMCMFSTGDYETALSHLQNGLALGGGEHKQEMMYTVGLCYERQLDYKSALKAFEDYVALFGSNEQLDKEIDFLRTR